MIAYSSINPEIKFEGKDQEEILEKVKCYLLQRILHYSHYAQKLEVNNKLYKRNTSRYELHYTRYNTNGSVSNHVEGLTLCYDENSVRKNTYTTYEYNPVTKSYQVV